MPVNFLRPDLAVWLVLLPLIALFWVLNLNAKRQFRVQSGYRQNMLPLSRLSTFRQDVMILSAALLATLAVVLAVMRPQLFIDRVLPEYERQDLVLVLDRSASMHARDVTPSRFVRAVEEIKSFLAAKPEEIDRVGLVGFAGTAITLSHLTRDLETLFFFLDWIGEDTRVYFGTDLAGALTNALDLVTKDEKLNSDKELTQKIFLVLSDGDDQSEKLTGLLNQMQTEQIRVHTIGIGTETAVPIPVAEVNGITEYMQDEEGKQLTTQFDESTLRMVADMTGGRFFRSTTGHDLVDMLNQIVQQERHQTGWKHTAEYMELYVPLLMLAGMCCMLLLVKI